MTKREFDRATKANGVSDSPVTRSGYRAGRMLDMGNNDFVTLRASTMRNDGRPTLARGTAYRAFASYCRRAGEPLLSL